MTALPHRRTSRLPLSTRAVAAYAAATLAVTLATVVGQAMTAHVALPNVSLVFLLAVLLAAVRFGVGPAIFASLLSVLAYNFFFIEPLHSFSVARPHELLALVVYLVIAVVTAAVAGQARDQARTAALRLEEVAAAQRAADTERIRNTLLASISHDFRTPLASIQGAASSLAELGPGLREDVRGDLLAQIRDEAEHLDGMVRNLLAITRVEAGALELNRSWVDLREVADRVVAAQRRRGGARVAVVCDPGTMLVRGDQSLLDQALGNLVGNAIDHGGPGVSVRVHLSRAAGVQRVAIEDDGPGIAPALLPRIFDKFVRGRSRTDGGEGTGLGLAIARGIVEAHGGRVIAESPIAEGRGSRFTIQLPAEEPDPA